MIDLWYKNAVIYCVDVDRFMDGNGDGIGDFVGLTHRLDHIAGLGATCIWLLPFYPSPNRDNGYDVTDYYGVHPELGTPGDFVVFMREARERGMRVIVDLVVNHTSDQHPWFQSARSDPDSPYRNYYNWSAEKPEGADAGVVFPGVQETTWTCDERVGAYYHHRFYKHQPDLNIANPAVREEIEKVMGFWLELGVSGFRLDAAPFLIELTGVDADAGRDPHAYLRELRDFLSWRRGDAIMLAEANVAADQIDQYFGDGDRMHMLFNFLANQHLFLALARDEAGPLRRTLRKLPAIPPLSQWASFLRNHDELDLGRLSDAERADAFDAFAPDPSMRLYERGIRRRLAPMLGGDRRRLELAYSLMLTLPGTPVLFYGEEIGMGDDLSLRERDSVRTPMQWSDDRNGGFSKAPREKLVSPVIEEGDYGCDRVNVTAESRDPHSFLNRMTQMIRARRSCPEFGWGRLRLLDPVDGDGREGVLAHRCDWRGTTVFAVHNLSPEPCEVTLDLGEDDGDGEGGDLTDVMSDREYERVTGPEDRVRVAGHGFRWLRREARRGRR